VPNQIKKGKKLVGWYEWESNINELKKEADRRGITLSELMKELTQSLIEQTGGEHKEHE